MSGWSYRFHCLHHTASRFRKLGCFRGRDPGKLDPPGFNTGVLQQVFQQRELASCVVVAFDVVTISRMAARNPDTIGAMPQSGQDEFGVDSSRTGHPNDADIRGILQAAHSSEIGSTIRTPVAQQRDNFRFPVLHRLFSSELTRMGRIDRIIQDLPLSISPNLSSQSFVHIDDSRRDGYANIDKAFILHILSILVQ
jgi:hypothetical protein